MRTDGAIKWYGASALAALLVLVAGWSLLVSPQRANAEEVNASAESKVAANVATERQIASLKVQYKDLPVLEQQLAAVRGRIPQAPNLPGLLRSLTTTAKTAGVVLTSVTPSVPAPLGGGSGSRAEDSGLGGPGQVNQVPMSLAVEGKFANLRLFLSGLEAMPRSFLVSSLDVKRDEEKAKAGIAWLKVTITGAVFTANPGLPTATTTTTTAGAPAAQPVTAS